MIAQNVFCKIFLELNCCYFVVSFYLMGYEEYAIPYAAMGHCLHWNLILITAVCVLFSLLGKPSDPTKKVQKAD